LLCRQVFNIEESQVFGLAEFKSSDRGLGFNFKLHEPINIDLKAFETFGFKLGSDSYTGKIFIPVGPPPELGTFIFNFLSHSSTS